RAVTHVEAEGRRVHRRRDAHGARADPREQRLVDAVVGDHAVVVGAGRRVHAGRETGRFAGVGAVPGGAVTERLVVARAAADGIHAPRVLEDQLRERRLAVAVVVGEREGEAVPAELETRADVGAFRVVPGVGRPVLAGDAGAVLAVHPQAVGLVAGEARHPGLAAAPDVVGVEPVDAGHQLEPHVVERTHRVQRHYTTHR